MKILIVDDELVSRKKMERIMQYYGACHAVEDGKAAIEAFTEAMLNREPFDLITLDVSMPDMSGSDALLTMRIFERKNAVPADRRVKVLMVTSHSDQATVTASIEAGCDDYIKKPFSLALVAQKMAKLGFTETLDASSVEPDA